jgi:hypothetical protein
MSFFIRAILYLSTVTSFNCTCCRRAIDLLDFCRVVGPLLGGMALMVPLVLLALPGIARLLRISLSRIETGPGGPTPACQQASKISSSCDLLRFQRQTLGDE